MIPRNLPVHDPGNFTKLPRVVIVRGVTLHLHLLQGYTFDGPEAGDDNITGLRVHGAYYSEDAIPEAPQGIEDTPHLTRLAGTQWEYQVPECVVMGVCNFRTHKR